MKLETLSFYEYSNCAIPLANNPVMGSVKLKHIDMRFHFLQGVVENGNMRIVHVGFNLQHADTLTKKLGGEPFRRRCKYAIDLTLRENSLGSLEVRRVSEINDLLVVLLGI